MNRFRRYWHLWQTLPDEERRERAGKVVERLLRRHRAVRSLGLAPGQPRWSALGRALTVELDSLPSRLREPDPRRGPLFAALEERAALVAASRPDHVRRILDGARALLDSRFDLLGSGPSRPLRADGGVDWHLDWKSGRRWSPETYYLDLPPVRGDGSDVKLPWELSRFQHLLVLGQAHRLAPHVLGATEADELRRRCAITARSQIDDWMERNPRGLGVNWTCAMEVAIRAVSWLAALALLRPAPEWDDAFLRRLVRSLWVHGRHVRRNLEIGGDGLTSNHYLSDVIGLYALGCALPELREAEAWRGLGRRALADEMRKQVHPDGVDFERSIPYHRLVTEIFLFGALTARARGDELPSELLERLGRMLEFIATYTRADGSAPQWGDNDDGRLLPFDGYASKRPNDHRHLLVTGGRLLGRPALAAAGAPREVEALWLLGRGVADEEVRPAGLESRGFADGGYYVMRSAELHCGVATGSVGTRGLGNHTHNDLFAVCIWATGIEWITDPGTGCYTGDPELRNRLRSTAAHATLQLGSREQNVWGDTLDDLFRLRECARPEVLEWRAGAEGCRLVARHRGFGTEAEVWVHERSITFEPGDRSWTVRDSLRREGAGSPPSDSPVLRFPLGPAVDARVLRAKEAWPPELTATIDRAVGDGFAAGSKRVRFAVELGGPEASRCWIGLDLPDRSAVTVDAGEYSPRYGVIERSRILTAVAPPSEETLVVSVVWCPRDR